MPADNPDHLFERAVAGDRLAIQSLLLCHHDRLIRAMAARLPEDFRGVLSAEDICQDAYVAAIRGIGSFQGPGDEAFFAWLRAIAENKLTDAVRGLRALKRGGEGRALDVSDAAASSVIAILDLLAVDERTPSRSAAGHELVAAVNEAMDQLPADYRDAVRLRYVQGLSVLETARRMGRAEGAVRMLCSRALSQLVERIGDPSRFLTRT